jgi:hypothetical protein
MKVILLISICISFLLSFNSFERRSNNDFGYRLDSIFSLLKDKNITSFNFENLRIGNVWNWPNSKHIVKADSSFYQSFLFGKTQFTMYSKDYQDIYFIGTTNFDKKRYLVLGQWIHNGDESNMYLIEFNDENKISKLLLVAELFKGPDDYIHSYSKLTENSLTRIKISESTDSKNLAGYSKDSITELFDLKDFKMMKYDSLRVN